MLLYAIVILSGASFALKYLWDFCDNYERALPDRKMNEYITSLNETHVRRLAGDFVRSLDHGIQSEEDAYAVILKCFAGGIRYHRILDESTDDTVCYVIENTETRLGTVTLARDPSKQGEKTWSVAEESYDFSFLLSSERFVVPENWVVMSGKRRLGVEYITDWRVEFPFLKEIYDKGFAVPYLSQYEISNYVGKADIRFYDADGVEQPRFILTDGKDQMSRSTGATADRIEVFVQKFAPLYIEFLANTSKAARQNYNRLRPYIVPGSDLDLRLQEAVAGQVFSQSNATVIKELRIHDIFDLENTYYVVDLSFTVDTYSDSGRSDSTTDMYIVLEVEEETVLAVLVNLY